MFLVPTAVLEDMLAASLQLAGAMNKKKEARRKTLETLLRRMFVAQLLSQRLVVAIGGTQGAGKTTLVRQLYNIGSDSEWLPANEGRGEHVPVLIEESPDVTEPEGWIYQAIPPADDRSAYTIGLVKLEMAQDFLHATRGADPSCLLPVLKVPVAHFHASGTALLLLPGYERRDRENGVWQELMRQALAGAGACVIVTDQRRLANSANLEILRDRELSSIEPVVVISKTEEVNEDKREELRKTAAKTFEDAGGLPGSIICTGTGTDYTEEWRPKLVEAIGAAGNSASHMQGLRTRQLMELLDEVRKLISDVEKELAETREDADDDWEKFIEKQLKPYEKAAKTLRNAYVKQLNTALAAHREEAWKHVLQAVKPDEGWGLLNGLLRTTSERLERQRALIENAWAEPGDCQECHLRALTHATLEKLNGPGLALLPRQTFSQGTALKTRTGYETEPGQNLLGIKPETADNLSILLNPDDKGELSKTIDKDIEYLPALAMEFTRLAQLAAIDQKILNTQKEGISALEAAAQAKDNFKELIGMQSEVASSIGTVFGVKADGSFYTLIGDLKAKLPKGGGAGRMDRIAGGLLLSADIFITGVAAAAVAAAGVVAVGLLVRAAEKAQLSQAESALDALQDAYGKAYVRGFDDVIEKVKDRLIEVQRAHLNLTHGVYERDRTARAVRRLESAADKLDHVLPPL